MDSIIRIENLTFEYKKGEETEPVRALDNVNLNIERGSFTAILGKNGSGKSTFAKNLNGLLVPTEGVIYVNGYDTSDDEHIWDVRQSAGMVFQNPDNQLVSAIVEDDVAFGPENLGIESSEIRRRVDKALSDVNMGAFKGKPPHLLSGGQKQRITIARALLKNPAILILDEATSALDTESERVVQKALDNLMKGRTSFVVAHRLSTILNADMIVVFNKGGVEAIGRHEEIIKTSPTYKKLYEMQFKTED